VVPPNDIHTAGHCCAYNIDVLWNIIRMYFAPGEHSPPHFHVYYAEYTATVDIRTCEMIEGNLPRKQIKLVLAWLNYIKKNS
jgi:hypothetical protein